MNIFKKLFLSIKNIFIKKNEIKKLPEPENDINQDSRNKFIESLKVTSIEKTNKKKVETLICNGDGLGIQKKIRS